MPSLAQWVKTVWPDADSWAIGPERGLGLFAWRLRRPASADFCDWLHNACKAMFKPMFNRPPFILFVASRESMTPASQPLLHNQAGFSFQGLAPFLRMSLAGEDIRPLAQAMMAQAEQAPDNASLWLALATAMMAMGLREPGLAIQAQALAMTRVYRLSPAASSTPARLTVLMLMAEGDLSANMPLDCLLEGCGVELIYYYLAPGAFFLEPIPEHDVVMVGMGESDENRVLLDALEAVLAGWPRPVANAAQFIPNTGRALASELLQNVPGLLMPLTYPATRGQLASIAAGAAELAAQFDGCDFPVIVRPVGSQGGHGLARVDDPGGMHAYLTRQAGALFFISRFIDYRSGDGMFRKMRVALVAGEPLACHMAVSSRWMVHYVNADMFEDAARRAEELAFMEQFDAFRARHGVALAAIAERIGLDYVCIDCAQTQAGELLVFEVDHAMVVHAMDQEALFPYKKIHMAKVRQAVVDFLLRLKDGAKTRQALRKIQPAQQQQARPASGAGHAG